MERTEVRLRALVDACPHGVQECDRDGIVTFSNKAQTRLTGWESHELVGRPIWDFVDGAEEQARLQAYLHMLIEHRPRPVPHETCGRSKHGRVFDVRIDLDYLCDEGGQVSGFAVVISDVSAYTRAQARLRRLAVGNESRFLSLFEGAADGILICDARGLILEANRACTRLVGYPSDELQAMNFSQLLEHDDGDNCCEIFAAIAAGAATNRECKCRYLRQDGSRFWGQASLSAVADQSAPELVMVIIRDVSEIERTAKHNALMLRELDHRVKNNMAATLGLLHLCADEVERADELVARIEGRLRAMAQIHELLARHHWGSLSLAELVFTAVSPFTADAGRLALFGPELVLAPATVVPLAQALFELATNATKYGALAVGGHIVVAWRHEAGALILDWLEESIVDDNRLPEPGVGFTLIRGLIEQELGGTTELECLPMLGVRWRMTLPLPTSTEQP